MLATGPSVSVLQYCLKLLPSAAQEIQRTYTTNPLKFFSERQQRHTNVITVTQACMTQLGETFMLKQDDR